MKRKSQNSPSPVISKMWSAFFEHLKLPVTYVKSPDLQSINSGVLIMTASKQLTKPGVYIFKIYPPPSKNPFLGNYLPLIFISMIMIKTKLQT